jgi:hypothetical protein
MDTMEIMVVVMIAGARGLWIRVGMVGIEENRA